MKDVLIKLRKENNYSQSLLAKMLGISRQAYMKYESGEVEPSVETVRKFSRIYKVSYEYLIDNGKVPYLKQTKYKIHSFEELEVASPDAEISVDESSVMNGKTASYFLSQLEYLKKIISSMQTQLELLNAQENSTEAEDLSKSKKFNKNEFFKAVGKVEIDSTCIDELREESKI